MTTTAEFAPIDENIKELLSRTSTATLATQLFRAGLRQRFLVGVKPVHASGQGFVGEAFTMRFIPAREDIDTLASLTAEDNYQWLAIESLQPGQVLVIDSRDDVRAASAGDMLVTRAMHRGAAGFVTDGAVRDGRTISELPFPTYARTTTATTRLSYFHVADLQQPIGCAGVAVYPGDVMVGDDDGVVCIPRSIVEQIATDAIEQEQMESYLHQRVQGGEPLWGVYPPDERTAADYARWTSAALSDGQRSAHEGRA